MFLNRERRLPIARQSLNALGKLDADVNTLVDISRDVRSVSRHNRLLLGLALLSQALGIDIAQADLLLDPNFGPATYGHFCPALARSK